MEMNLETLRIGIVGAGHMGQALLTGWVKGQQGAAVNLSADNFAAVNPGAEKCAKIQEHFGISCFKSVRELPACDVVVLCVKPQVIFDVLHEAQELAFLENTLILSPAAGVTCASVEAALPGHARVVRFMPNMPLAIARGVIPAALGAHAAAADQALATALFSAVGSVYWIDESLMDAVTALSGSGPGYVAAMLAAMTEAGMEAGLDTETAEALARDTLEGTAAYMRELGKHPEETRDAIATPGGTTRAGLEAMEEAGFSAAVKAGIAAAAARSAELTHKIIG